MGKLIGLSRVIVNFLYISVMLYFVVYDMIYALAITALIYGMLVYRVYRRDGYWNI